MLSLFIFSYFFLSLVAKQPSASEGDERPGELAH